jgi:tetratricopeptide (TPR) repeat protein
MLLIYWVTLNHWVTQLNLRQVAAAAGWLWQPEILTPLMQVVTLPFHWLPVAWIPVSMNLFASLCAAATLAVLARTVAILPHDRTELERLRERCDFAYLTGSLAWIPPVAAVIFLGFHLGFWKNATSFSGDIFELLWFAVILWQLLEYRLDEREGRLFLTAVMYGAGMVESWSFLGFFPLFLTMIIWLRGMSFFSGWFLLRMLAGGLAGVFSLLFVVVPLAAKFSGVYSVGIGDAIALNWDSAYHAARLLRLSDIRHCIALVSLTSLLPALAMSIRWSATFGDNSRIGTILVNYCMYFVNLVFLGILAWVNFDPPFSPVHILSNLGGISALSIYYIAAVCLGYYSGFFMVVFGKDAIPTRRNNRPDPALPKGLLWLCPVIIAAELAALAIGAAALVYKNTPAVLAANDDSLAKFGRFTTEKLPPEGAILLCDSDNPNQDLPYRSWAVQAELAHEGRWQKYPVVDTKELKYLPYHFYLHQHFPQYWPSLAKTNVNAMVPPILVLRLLDHLSRSNNLCYLNPSFGEYFELFYQEPHGLVYTLKALPTNTLAPPPLTTNLIAENEAFWKQVVESSGPAIRTAMHPVNLALQGGAIGWLMSHLHATPESNPNALRVGEYYSMSLNTLGVGVQRVGDLDRAAKFFAQAQEFNSNNVVAAVNLEFNKTLRSGASTTTVDISRASADQFGKYTSWNEVLAANGPFDETSFCWGVGCSLIQGHLTRQAAVEFNRVRQLAPDNLATRLFLGQIYLINRMPDLAAQAIHDPLTHPFRFALTEANSTDLNEQAAAIDFATGKTSEGVALLETEMNRHPDDEQLLIVAAKTFNRLHLHTNALNAINRKLKHTPNDPTWLFGKGMVCLQAGAFDEAVGSFNKYLETQTNPAAIFDRGLAYFRGGHLDEARADFLGLQKAHTNDYQLALSLGEIAWQQRQTNEAIRNYHIFLTNAPARAAEQKAVRQRLTDLGAQ